ncbi:MAG: hypothetical protein ACHQZQ_01220, partial [SAR324 cluster bacterium]
PHAWSQPAPPHPLVAALWDLYDTVTARPDQTVNRLAEQSVLAWIGCVEGKGLILPRVNASGYVPAGFHFGMELNPGNQLDRVDLDGGLDAYRTLLDGRLERMLAVLRRFVHHTGYRNTTEQCDQTMVELSHLSRFLGARCLEVERASGGPLAAERLREAPTARAAETAPVDLFSRAGSGSLLFEARFQMFFWEPFLNDAIVAWQQNSLPDYLHTLQRLRETLHLPAAARRTMPHEPGFPCRALGRPRVKTVVIRPEGRPLRGQSMFDLRLGQLIRRVESQPNLSLRVALELEREVRHFIRMAEGGVYPVSAEPSFQGVGRPALSLIRSKPTVHPFLLDPTEFFKKALLFFNGTYTIAGGGLDPMYRQLRQLERYYRFELWASARDVRAPLQACLIAWEENRWREFTAGVLRVAELVRGDAAA